MKTLELRDLKAKKAQLENDLNSLSNDIYLFKLKETSKIREYLSYRFDNIQEIIMNDTNLVIYTYRSRGGNSEITISNNHIWGGIYTFNPNLSWSSATISSINRSSIDYINVVSFIASEMKDIDSSELFGIVKNLFIKNYLKGNDIRKITNEISVVSRQIDHILYTIKLEEFMGKLGSGNFYYNFSSGRWSGDNHNLVYVAKVNPKTVTVILNNTRNVENIKSLMVNMTNPSYYTGKRIRKEEIFNVLSKYDLIEGSVDEFLLNVKFKNAIKKIKKEKGISFVRDIKLLCKTLKEMNVTTVNVPGNDILSYISKWRHNVLENR